jgi:hypothetical protein
MARAICNSNGDVLSSLATTRSVWSWAASCSTATVRQAAFIETGLPSSVGGESADHAPSGVLSECADTRGARARRAHPDASGSPTGIAK